MIHILYTLKFTVIRASDSLQHSEYFHNMLVLQILKFLLKE